MKRTGVLVLSSVLLVNLAAMAATDSLCLKSYEPKTSLIRLFEKNTHKNKFDFLPLAVSSFLTEKYDVIYSSFEKQLDRLMQVGDKNMLSSTMSTSKIAFAKNQESLTRIHKHLNPGLMSLSKLSSVEARSEQLEKLITEAN